MVRLRRAWRSAARRDRAFAVASTVFLGLVALAWLGARTWILLGDGRTPSELRQAERVLGAGISLALATYALALLAYLFAGRRLRMRWAPVALLALYAGVETWVVPRWSWKLRLAHYRTVLDPDHRPRPDEPGYDWNSDALRGTPEPAAFRPGEPNLIFLGDSFTFGLFVEEEECFASRVRESLRKDFPSLQIANFGWVSSSPVLSWRRLVEIGDKYHPSLVALFVDITDFHDDIKWEGMLERRGIYWFYRRAPLAIRALQAGAPGLFRSWWSWSNEGAPFNPYFMTEAPLEQTRRWCAPLERNLARIRAWTQERGIPFVVFALPRSYQYSERECPRESQREGREHTRLGPHCEEPFRWFEELSAQVDYPVHSLFEHFRDSAVFPHCFERDPHWNAAGHALAAEAIAARLAAMLASR